MPHYVISSLHYCVRAQCSGTCAVHRYESLLHEQMLQVLVVHGDFSHHVAWHVTGETAGLAVIETIRVFVSRHLTNAQTVL